MQIRNTVLAIVAIALVATLLGMHGTTRTAQAFSTTNHKNITKDALREVGGFSGHAFDYLVATSDDPDSGSMKGMSGAHYSNCAWNEGRDWIRQNRRDAVEYAYVFYKDGTPAYISAVYYRLGYVFHAAQDFYSHSNWIETHPWGQIANLEGPWPGTGWYSTVGNKSPDRCTYGHRQIHGTTGIVCDLFLNKDTKSCKGFSEARHGAVLATVEQWQLFEQAVHAKYPGEANAIINTVKTYVPPPPTPGPPPKPDPTKPEL